MSRSYKHTPISKDGNSGKKAKQMANRHFRRLSNKEFEQYSSRKGYRRHTNPWDIHDWINYWSREQAIQDYYRNCTTSKFGFYCTDWFIEKYPTLEDYLQYWLKCMTRK